MANLGTFDANTVEPMATFEAIPAGEYVAAITASEMKDNKAGTGSYLELTFTVLEGAYRGRMLWARLNLHNPNEIAVKIARAELAAICKAVGVLQPRDSCELHNLPLEINVKCAKRKDNDELTNEIKGYARHEPAPVSAPAPSTGAAPWAR